MGWILFVLAAIALVIVQRGRIADVTKAGKAAEDARRAADEAKRASDEAAQRFQQQIDTLNRELLSLRPFENVRDAMAATAALREQGRRILAEAAKEANVIRAAALAEAEHVRSEAVSAANALKLDAKTSHADAQAKTAALIDGANKRAETIIADAEARALEVAGDAYRAIKEADQLRRVAAAMENVIEGYGDRYLVPTYSLLDQLGEAYGFDQAGRELTAAREITQSRGVSSRSRLRLCRSQSLRDPVAVRPGCIQRQCLHHLREHIGEKEKAHR